MKVNGIDETEHKIFAEIERNRRFIQQIKAAEGQDEPPGVGTDPQKRLKLDQAAAMRMTKGVLNDEKERQDKAGLRKVNKGSILPQREHLNWKEKVQRLQE